MSHLEVYAEASYAMYKNGGEVAGIPQAVMPGRPKSLHLMPSQRTIQAGEPFAVDQVGVYKRYHVNVCRTFFWGDPSPELLRLNEASAGAFDVLARTAKAGTPVATVNRAMREYYQSKGVWEHRSYIGGA